MKNIRIGTAGWGIPRLLAEQFPGNSPHLARYATKLNCAEINSCFYREHKPDTYKKWADSVPENFRFSVKMPRAVTHDGKLGADTLPLVERFLQQTAVLDDKRGPILLQTPPRLQFDPSVVRSFLEEFRALYDGAAVIEPRHESWFEEAADAVLREFRVARVAADPVASSIAARPGGSSDLIYYRLHGSPRRYYSSYQSDYLSRLAVEISAAGSDAWCVFDNTASGAALGNALELQRALGLPS